MFAVDLDKNVANFGAHACRKNSSNNVNAADSKTKGTLVHSADKGQKTLRLGATLLVEPSQPIG